MLACYKHITGADSHLQSHSIHHKLHGEELAVSSHAVSESRLGSVVLAELVDKVPHDLVQHGSPDGSDSVDGGHAVGVSVDVWVNRGASRVRVGADSSGVVVDPSAHGVALGTSVGGLQPDGSCHEVTPALSHTTRLQGTKAVGVCRTAGETVRNCVIISIRSLISERRMSRP